MRIHCPACEWTDVYRKSPENVEPWEHVVLEGFANCSPCVVISERQTALKLFVVLHAPCLQHFLAVMGTSIIFCSRTPA